MFEFITQKKQDMTAELRSKNIDQSLNALWLSKVLKTLAEAASVLRVWVKRG